jgi:hypothetical protein
VADGDPVPAPGATTEATKTEPDKNTYLVLRSASGPDAKYDYGHHFLFQGHEGAGLITRINLDGDQTHRVTAFATTYRSSQDGSVKPLPNFDGSTWDPFAHRLLFSAESGAPSGGVWEAPLAYNGDATNPSVRDLSGSIGSAGYEGIQTDSAGDVSLIADQGGATGALYPNAKQPNSFVYRFVPEHRSDLTSGKLQVLQVWNAGKPITFTQPSCYPTCDPKNKPADAAAIKAAADADIKSANTLALHTYGNVLPTRWVTIHDTETDGTKPFDANALAKSKGGTPFKRPENGQFRPDGTFRSFVFDETGDTNADSEAGSAYGGYGSILRLDQPSATANSGTLRLVYLSDKAHSGFDNVAFWGRDQVVFVEDAGDLLHTQRNALDSGYVFDLHADYSNPATQPLRLMAQGRDASATLDSAANGFGRNDGDNEITGFHVSNGDPGRDGLLGAETPQPFEDGWRVFYTQQHGDNVTYEIVPNPQND